VSFPPAGDDPFPATLPMLGCTGLFDPSEDTTEANLVTPGSFPTGDQKKESLPIPHGPRSIYLHGHAVSRLFQVSKAARLPTTIAASSMQGIVLSLTPFHNSCNYTSAVVHGYSSIVTDEAERMYALTIITDNLVPERWDNSRVPPTKAELASTGVIRVDIESASAKIRVGWPGDDRADMKNEELVERVWTGVVPCWTQFGEPQQGPYNRVKRVPGYLESFVQEESQKLKDQAFNALLTDGKK
jgi:nitroimidazol reductase NimA-like FMN-containing flavoprotein (pyridoxamine 5'-phosphate oxidase superfamily)